MRLRSFGSPRRSMLRSSPTPISGCSTSLGCSSGPAPTTTPPCAGPRALRFLAASSARVTRRREGIYVSGLTVLGVEQLSAAGRLMDPGDGDAMRRYAEAVVDAAPAAHPHPGVRDLLAASPGWLPLDIAEAALTRDGLRQLRDGGLLRVRAGPGNPRRREPAGAGGPRATSRRAWSRTGSPTRWGPSPPSDPSRGRGPAPRLRRAPSARRGRRRCRAGRAPPPGRGRVGRVVGRARRSGAGSDPRPGGGEIRPRAVRPDPRRASRKVGGEDGQNREQFVRRRANRSPRRRPRPMPVGPVGPVRSALLLWSCARARVGSAPRHAARLVARRGTDGVRRRTICPTGSTVICKSSGITEPITAALERAAAEVPEAFAAAARRVDATDGVPLALVYRLWLAAESAAFRPGRHGPGRPPRAGRVGGPPRSDDGSFVARDGRGERRECRNPSRDLTSRSFCADGRPSKRVAPGRLRRPGAARNRKDFPPTPQAVSRSNASWSMSSVPAPPPPRSTAPSTARIRSSPFWPYSVSSSLPPSIRSLPSPP